MTVLLGVAGVALVGQIVVNRRQLCSGGEDRVAAVWNGDRAAAVTLAFESTGMAYAAETAARVSENLTRRGEEWIAAYTDVCEATRVRGEASEDLLDRQMACLGQRLQEMDRLLDLFESADEALASLLRGLIAAEKGGADRVAVGILNELVWVQGVMLQQFDRADFWSQLAEAGLHRVSDDGALMSEILYSRAAILGAEGRYDEALGLQERAYLAVVAAEGAESLGATYAENQLADALFSVGSYAHLNRVSIYRKLEQLDLGLEEARSAERILSEAFGSDHPLYAYAANAEGVILLLMGRPLQALAPLETAVRIREGVTTDPLVLAQTRFSLAKALWAVGADTKRALSLVEQSRIVFVAEGERAEEDLVLLEAWEAER